MYKIELPQSIPEDDRRALEEYVGGRPPKDIIDRWRLDGQSLQKLRIQYGLPSQLELRRALQTVIDGSLKNVPDAAPRVREVDPLAKCVEEYREGRGTIKSLSEAHGLSRHTIRTELDRLNIKVRPGPPLGPRIRQLSPRNQAIVDAVIKEGKTLREVGAAQHPPMTHQRVQQIISRAGYVLRTMPDRRRLNGRQRYHHPMETQIVTMLQEGKISPRNIAEQFGVQPHYVERLRRENGVSKFDRLNLRSDEQAQREADAIAAYYQRPDLTVTQISRDILGSNNPAGIVQLVRRRGLERTRARERFGENYRPSNSPRYARSQEEIDRIAKIYRDVSLTVEQVLERTGLRKSTLANFVARHGIRLPEGSYRPRRRSGRMSVLNDTVRAAALADYRAGLTFREISRRHDISPTTINRIVSKAGLPLRRPRK